MHRFSMRRFVGLVAATTVLVGTVGAGAGAQENIRIGVTFPVLDQFLQTVETGMQTKAAEIGGVELVVVSAEEDTTTQLGQVENFIVDEVDAIVIIPVDTDAAGPMTEAAQGANIPIVYVNRVPSDLPADGSVPYVGSDSLFAGTVEMEMLAELAGNEGNVVILVGDPANEAAVQRTQGCKNVIDQHEGLVLTKEQSGNWRRDEGLAIMENWIQSGDQIDIVCANNDEMALGAIEALRENDLLDSVIVGGVDATVDAIAAMDAGDLEVTVFQNADAQGGGGIQAAVELVNGEAVTGIQDNGWIDVPYEPVSPANVDDYRR